MDQMFLLGDVKTAKSHWQSHTALHVNNMENTLWHLVDLKNRWRNNNSLLFSKSNKI